MPTIVTRTQKPTTVRLCARTQRVRAVKAHLHARRWETNRLYHKRLEYHRIRIAMRFENPPPEPLASAPGFLLSFSGQRMARNLASALEPLGLRPPHFGVLRLIDANPGSTQRELVERSM